MSQHSGPVSPLSEHPASPALLTNPGPHGHTLAPHDTAVSDRRPRRGPRTTTAGGRRGGRGAGRGGGGGCRGGKTTEQRRPRGAHNFFLLLFSLPFSPPLFPFLSSSSSSAVSPASPAASSRFAAGLLVVVPVWRRRCGRGRLGEGRREATECPEESVVVVAAEGRDAEGHEEGKGCSREALSPSFPGGGANDTAHATAHRPPPPPAPPAPHTPHTRSRPSPPARGAGRGDERTETDEEEGGRTLLGCWGGERGRPPPLLPAVVPRPPSPCVPLSPHTAHLFSPLLHSTHAAQSLRADTRVSPRSPSRHMSQLTTMDGWMDGSRAHTNNHTSSHIAMAEEGRPRGPQHTQRSVARTPLLCHTQPRGMIAMMTMCPERDPSFFLVFFLLSRPPRGRHSSDAPHSDDERTTRLSSSPNTTTTTRVPPSPRATAHHTTPHAV